MAKGGVPTYLALLLNDKSNISSDLFISLVALSAFLGHLYPCFMKFKDGGKGVATATGCFLIISPFACIISFTVFFITVFLSNRVSAGSLVASAVLPFATWLINGSIILTSCAALIACFIFIRHSGNIKRLISGTEPVFKEKKK
jgi:glycerol-3-phosphate acyltransferase PlsY